MGRGTADRGGGGGTFDKEQSLTGLPMGMSIVFAFEIGGGEQSEYIQARCNQENQRKGRGKANLIRAVHDS